MYVYVGTAIVLRAVRLLTFSRFAQDNAEP